MLAPPLHPLTGILPPLVLDNPCLCNLVHPPFSTRSIHTRRQIRVSVGQIPASAWHIGNIGLFFRVDIGAIEFIHRRLIEQRDAGKAVLLISAELDEIRSLSDRIAVMYEGKIVDIVAPDATEEELGLLMTGHNPNE